MKNLILLVMLVMISPILKANTIEAKLIGECQDGKTIKLMWFVKKWDKNLVGFNIKKKNKDGQWVSINNEPIVPEVYQNKNLQIVENSTEELIRLKSKLKSLLEQGVLKSMDNKSFIQSLLKNNDTLKILSRSFGSDFDLALISGFGLIDRNNIEDKEQYGLFPVRLNGEEKSPVAMFTWNSKDNIHLEQSINVNSTYTETGVKLLWSLPLNTINKIHAKGFNIYKKEGTNWVKINNKPVTEFDNLNNGYTFNDHTQTDENITYAITIATMFNNEGIKNQYLVLNRKKMDNNIASNN